MFLCALIQPSGFLLKLIWIHLYRIQYACVTCQFYSSFAFFQLYFEWLAVKYVPCIVFFIGQELKCGTLF